MDKVGTFIRVDNFAFLIYISLIILLIVLWNFKINKTIKEMTKPPKDDPKNGGSDICHITDAMLVNISDRVRVDLSLTAITMGFGYQKNRKDASISNVPVIGICITGVTDINDGKSDIFKCQFGIRLDVKAPEAEAMQTFWLSDEISPESKLGLIKDIDFLSITNLYGFADTAVISDKFKCKHTSEMKDRITDAIVLYMRTVFARVNYNITSNDMAKPFVHNVIKEHTFQLWDGE